MSLFYTSANISNRLTTVIFIGAVLLALPIASYSGEATPFIDCIFTSTSDMTGAGRVSPLTLVLAFAKRGSSSAIRYPEDRILVG